MSATKKDFSETLYIKHMVSHSCKLFLIEKLEAFGLNVKAISLGKITIVHPAKMIPREPIEKMLSKYGFELIQTHEEKIVEKIKIAVIELIHHLNNSDSIVRKSDYIVEKIGLSYQYLSKLFSEKENRTLEKYIILQKIERIKHLIDNDELSLSEIAYFMDYSSVQYLSNQFKATTGMTISQYKDSDRSSKLSIDRL